MEFAVALALLGAGYAISQQENETGSEIPNGENIYENRDYQKIQGEVLQKNTNDYIKFRAGDPRKILSGPPQPLLNKIDFKDPVYPVVAKNSNQFQDLEEEHKQEEKAGQENFYGMSLTGNPIDPATFRHNNEVPFFGAKVTQNVDENAGRSQFEHFTGQQANYRLKQEVGRMFPMQNNVGNPYGSQNLDGNQRDRYIPGNVRNNEAPIQKVSVGPGLNQGYTALPSGGVQQAETRDYVLPKTVDEMRVKTNPKVSYEGRVISGKHIDKRGVIGRVNKNLPDSYYINTPDRYFTTVGAVSGPKQRPAQVLKSTKRKITSGRGNFRTGPATNTDGKARHSARNQRFKKTHNKRIYYKNELFRNMQGLLSKWFGANYDYGIEGYDAKQQNRDETGANHHQGNVQQQNGSYIKGTDKAKRTIKETTLSESQLGGMKGSEHGYIKDPNDIARTTVKETTLSESQLGAMKGNEHGYIKDPNDRARTTIKETTIDNDYIYAGKGDEKAPVGILDEIRTTLKQLLVGDGTPDYRGGSYNRGGGHHLKKMKAKETNRQCTTKEYFGDAGTNVPAPVNEDYMRNARTNSNKEKIARGRSPTKVGRKKITSKEAVHMSSKRTGDTTNRAINKRGVMSTKTYNSLPQKDASLRTKHKKQLDNEKIDNRLDTSILDAFRNNPYTKPLNSTFT